MPKSKHRRKKKPKAQTYNRSKAAPRYDPYQTFLSYLDNLPDPDDTCGFWDEAKALHERLKAGIADHDEAKQVEEQLKAYAAAAHEMANSV